MSHQAFRSGARFGVSAEIRLVVVSGGKPGWVSQPPTMKTPDLGHCSVGDLEQKLGKNPIIIIMVLLRYEWACRRLSSRCCHLLLCDTTVPLKLPQPEMPKVLSAGDVFPRGWLGMGTSSSPSFYLAFCMPRGTILLSHPCPPCCGSSCPPGPASPPPTFVSSHPHHTIATFTFCFLTFFFLTDKRVLSEPKSHRKCSFHGHFVSLRGIALVLLCRIHGRAPRQLGQDKGGKRKQLKPTPNLQWTLNAMLCLKL